MAAILRADDPEAMELAAEALADGSVVAVPTDTVYGLAADPCRPEAVERLFALKQRPADVALPVLVAGLDQVDALARPLETAAQALAERFWPGPLTLVVPRRPGFAVDLGGRRSAGRTVGIRWPDHQLVQELCRRLGPLAVTSANIHGSAPATTADQVAQAFAGAGQPVVILDGGVCDGVPSTVVECRGPTSRCLREGAVAWSEILDHRPCRPTPGGGR
jgi:tRNA threonylcarbamoyl adenosine modification protein (Sua5/YciO/YrdC/YwlC family)